MTVEAKPKWTSGPLTATAQRNAEQALSWYVGCWPLPVAEVYDGQGLSSGYGGSNAEAQANAQLFAAASDLYDGCGALLGLIDLVLARDDLTPELRAVLTDNHRIDEARAARAKARGES